MFKIWCCDGQIGALTNKIAGDGLVLLRMVARPGYGGKHIELDLACNGKSGFHELWRCCHVSAEGEEETRGGPEV